MPAARDASAEADRPLLARVLAGLRQPQKSLPPTLFYDGPGSDLFDRITRLDEYYLTRAEAEILAARGAEIARCVAHGEPVVVIEPGCGSAEKIAALLVHLQADTYVGIDVAADALAAGAAALRARFPALRVLTQIADYHEPFALPALPAARRVVFFPGSTLGNFDRDEASPFLARLGALAGPTGHVVLGIDLWKDAEVLRAAYDDREGVTAAFDLNALSHLNWRFAADFDLSAFRHEARVNAALERVEMHLVAERDVRFAVAGESFALRSGESLHTESAHKWTLPGFARAATAVGLAPVASWTDRAGRFAVVALRAPA